MKYLEQASTSSKATMASTTFFETSSVKDYGVWKKQTYMNIAKEYPAKKMSMNKN